LTCKHTACVLKEHKEKRQQDFNSNQGFLQLAPSKSNKPKKSGAQPPARAGQTSVVKIGNDSSGDSYSQSEVSGAANIVSRISKMKQTNFNLDSGCSVSLTPFLSTITHPKDDSTPIRLADSTMVRSTHSGRTSIPLGVATSVKTLVVPNLHKPLLSIAGLCDKGLLVCFNSASCCIFKHSNFLVDGTEVGAGYHRGNLFYLPAITDVRFPCSVSSNQSISAYSALSIQAGFDSSILGYHNILSHIGLRPLKAILKLHGIRPSALNEMEVQKSPICIQSKMHWTNFKTRSPYHSTLPGQLINSDLCSYEQKSREGYDSYFYEMLVQNGPNHYECAERTI
jgi:hypothetical protein